MLRRTTQVLKLFALLVFSLELLTPLLLSAESTTIKNQGTEFVNANAIQNQLLCLFAEEVDASEESGEGHKEFTVLYDFDLVSVLYLQIETTYSSLVYVQHTYKCLELKPRLFLLNSTLLIWSSNKNCVDINVAQLNPDPNPSVISQFNLDFE